MADIAVQLGEALRDHYVIERELGRGGMATVYLARDLKHDRLVALKVLRPELAAALGPERFLHEIRLAARLQHPHILTVLDSGQVGTSDLGTGLLWYTMPYVEGESLRDRLTRERYLPVEDALRIAREVALALDYAHRHGVVHRDVKPENVLLSDGQALLADFGVARALTAEGGRLTEAGLALGTPAYMSPEQASGDRELDGRCDVYALGSVLYEMLAGEPPFTGPTAQAVVAKRLRGPAPSLSEVRAAVGESVARAVAKALALIPADRFQTSADFAKALVAVDPSPPPSGSPQSRLALPLRWSSRATALALVLGLLVTVTMGMFLWELGHHTRASARETPPTTGKLTPTDASPRASVGGQPSIAVLPFANLSSDRENEYFSDGMTEELITSLGRVEGLRVAARASSFTFKGKPLDVSEVGRKLDVGAVLDGSVRRAGRRLRVTAELVRASDGTRLWAESYDRELRDVFAVQDDLARAITGALMPQLEPRGPPPRLSRTGDIEAYDLYLRGRYAWGRRTQEGFNQARRFFEQAIARDSMYAQAYAGLADVYLVLPNWTPTAADGLLPKAESLAVKALTLDSTLAEAHATLGAALAQYRYDWAGAKREISHAIALDPSYATGARYLAVYYLMPRGQLDDALREVRKAVELDPLSTAMNTLLGLLLSWAGHSDDAITLLRRLLRSDPGFGQGNLYAALATAYLAKGMPREAIATYQEAISAGRMRPNLLGILGYAYGVSGNRREAFRVLDQMNAEAKRSYIRPTEFADVYLGLGDTDQAFEWYERACTEHDYGLFYFPAGPRTRSLQGDPRRETILRCMHLAVMQ